MDQQVDQHDNVFDQRVTMGTSAQHHQTQVRQHNVYRIVRTVYATASLSTY
jgi:hypothetical protein